MKIKLLVDLPINAEHGATKGRVIECVKSDIRGKEAVEWIGDSGDVVKAYRTEYQVISD